MEEIEAERPISWPNPGACIQSPRSQNRYVIGDKIGEWNFSLVYSCVDTWGNELVANILKPNSFKIAAPELLISSQCMPRA